MTSKCNFAYHSFLEEILSQDNLKYTAINVNKVYDIELSWGEI